MIFWDILVLGDFLLGDFGFGGFSAGIFGFWGHVCCDILIFWFWVIFCWDILVWLIFCLDILILRDCFAGKVVGFHGIEMGRLTVAQDSDG